MNETETRQTAGLGAEMPAGQEQSATDAGQGAGMPASPEQSATDAAQGAGIATDAGQGEGMPANMEQSATDAGADGGLLLILPDEEIQDEVKRLSDYIQRLYDQISIKNDSGKIEKLDEWAESSQIFMIYIHLQDLKKRGYYFSEYALREVLGETVVDILEKLEKKEMPEENKDDDEQMTLPLDDARPESLDNPGEEMENVGGAGGKKKSLQGQISVIKRFSLNPTGRNAKSVTKLSQNIDELKTGENRISVGGKGKETFVTVRASCELKHFDVEVEGAIARLMMRGYKEIPLRDIFLEMNGEKGSRTSPIGESYLKALADSVWKLINNKFEIDYTEQWRLNHPHDKTIKDKYRQLLHADYDVDRNENGDIKNIILRPVKIPLLSEYSMDIGQVASYPIEVLHIPGSYTVRKTEIRKILMDQMLRGFQKKENPIIKISTLFQKLGLELAKDIKYRVIDECKEMLLCWAEMGYIRGYELEKAGKSVEAIKILIYNMRRLK